MPAIFPSSDSSIYNLFKTNVYLFMDDKAFEWQVFYVLGRHYCANGVGCIYRLLNFLKHQYIA